MSEYWTCKGSVRGECGIKHRSRETAERCCAKDSGSIKRAYPSQFPTQAYSDRYPIHIVDGQEVRDIPSCWKE